MFVFSAIRRVVNKITSMYTVQGWEKYEKKNVKGFKFHFLLIIFLCSISCGSSVASDFILAESGKAKSVIVIAPNANKVIRNASIALQKIINERTDCCIPIKYKAPKGKTAIYIGTLNSNDAMVGTLKKMGLSVVSSNNPGKEGFSIHSGLTNKGASVIIINGCDDLGSFHGVGWFLRKVEFTNLKALVPSGIKIVSAPKTIMRRMRYGDHLGLVNMESANWKVLWTDYILWGLSAVTLRCDPAHQGDPRETELGQMLWDRWIERVPIVKELGLDLVHLTQTNVLFKDGEFGPQSVSNFKEMNYKCFDWNGVNPKTKQGRELISKSRKWFFEHLPFREQVDYYITSAFDSSGCFDKDVQPWSITYPKLLVDQLLYPNIKKYSPNAKIILSLYWSQNPEKWDLGTLEPLAEEFHKGWRPEWLYAIEFCGQDHFAPLFPKDIPRFMFPHVMTGFDARCYDDPISNPCLRETEKTFRHYYDDLGVRGGTGSYCEGTHDYMNQIMMLQLNWDPNQTMDKIADEICNFYFGKKAAPLVREMMLRMENERIAHLENIVFDPDIAAIADEAEKLMPKWAKDSRQWQLLKGRVGNSYVRHEMANLLKDWDKNWNKYKGLLNSEETNEIPEWIDETINYFQNVHKTGLQWTDVLKTAQNRGFALQGGSQLLIWPPAVVGDAYEAMRDLKELKSSKLLKRMGRPCIAILTARGKVATTDSWGNVKVCRYSKASDARMVFAHLEQQRLDEIVFRNEDKLCAWEPKEKVRVIAKGQFLTGPLAKGDLNGDGLDEIIILCGSTEDDGKLVIVNNKGKITPLNIKPTGGYPDIAPKGILKNEPKNTCTVNIKNEPYVLVADVDGDGNNEIVCGSVDHSNKIVVLNANGNLKLQGPVSSSGVITSGDWDGDLIDDIIFMDNEQKLAIWSLKNGTTYPKENITCPSWRSAITTIKEKDSSCCSIVYAGKDGYLYKARKNSIPKRLNSLLSTKIFGPGMVRGDLDGDGTEDIAYLRSRACKDYPLANVGLIDSKNGVRDVSIHNIDIKELVIAESKRIIIIPPLGVRAFGQMRFL